MSYKVEFHAADLDVQVELLKHFPEIANRNFYPAMQRSVRAVKTAIGSRMSFNDRTGRARSAMMSKVGGKGVNITGRVGWWGSGMPWYVNILEYGAGPHVIGYVPALDVAFTKSRPHPGVPAMKFVAGGYEAARPEVESEMETALFRTVADLEAK
jgi:hypothetical protein